LPKPLRRRLVRYRKTTPDPQVQAPIRAGRLNRARIAYYQPRSQIWRPIAKMHSKSFLTTPRIARASKPKPSPESKVSPRIRAKQPETSPKGGSCTAHLTTQERDFPKAPESPIASYSRLKPGVSQATFRFLTEETELRDMD